MAHAEKDWRIAMIEAHPNLFHPAGAQPVRGYPSCGDGWRDLLERACNRIESALADGGGAFTAWQIKEKFGGLRFYWYGDVSPETKSKIDDAIALAEGRSACTCETCGEPGRLYQISGWYKTACRAHAPADVEPVPVEPGRENVHLVRTATPEGFRRVPRRYDRATDSFVDIESGSPGIQEE
jgi:hypothetical protein